MGRRGKSLWSAGGRRLGSAVLAVGVMTLVGAAPASARVDACHKEPGVAPLTLDIQNYAEVTRSGDSIAIFGGSGPAMPSPVTCSPDATPLLSEVTKIVVTGFRPELTISQDNGHLGPGAGPDDATPEIEFDLTALTSTTPDMEYTRLYVTGRPGVEDRIHLGDAAAGAAVAPGMDLNADGDVDIVMSNENTFTSRVTVRASRGEDDEQNDVITAAGDEAGFFGPFTLRGLFWGGAGDDVLVAGRVPPADGADPFSTELGGGPGDDTMTGGPNGELFTQLAGDDTISGGRGRDQVDYVGLGSEGEGVTVTLGNSLPQDTGPGGTDTISGVEQVGGTRGDDTLAGSSESNLLVGGPGDDNLAGLLGRDALHGGAGVDFLHGGSEPDRLFAGRGNDRLYGSYGDDRMLGQAGTDTADYRGPTPVGQGVRVDLDFHGRQRTGFGLDTLEGLENVRGTNYDDVLRGDGARNLLYGVGGDDVIAGRGGADLLAGGGGDDTIRARDGGRDRVTCGAGSDWAIADRRGVDDLDHLWGPHPLNAFVPEAGVCERTGFAPRR